VTIKCTLYALGIVCCLHKSAIFGN